MKSQKRQTKNRIKKTDRTDIIAKNFVWEQWSRGEMPSNTALTQKLEKHDKLRIFFGNFTTSTSLTSLLIWVFTEPTKIQENSKPFWKKQLDKSWTTTLELQKNWRWKTRNRIIYEHIRLKSSKCSQTTGEFWILPVGRSSSVGGES